MKKIFLVLFLGLLVWFWVSLKKPIFFQQALEVGEGDTLYQIVEEQSDGSLFWFKLYTRFFGADVDRLQVGLYPEIVGRVSKDDFFSSLSVGPQQNFVRVKLLEGWSIFDYDSYLANEGYITAGEYTSYVSDGSMISSLSDVFPFLKNFGSLSSLEGFLYPETYFVDDNDRFLQSLVAMQLKEFEERVWNELGSNLADQGQFRARGVNLNPYEIINLASVVEKEERVLSQQKDVAGVLLNRLKNQMRIDADITLCYGLQQGYEFCSPEVIVRNLYDKTNVYNTRQLMGLPPTPIASVTSDAISSVLKATNHDFLYYLHDSSGRLHMSRDLDEHNDKKQRYL